MIKVSFLQVKGLINNCGENGFNELLKTAEQYKDTFSDSAIGSIPGVEVARKLFHYIHIDPTKYRPSSEALLRRALKSKDFFKINAVVDICNWCSLDFLLPICAYDSDKIKGEITLRLGKPGEEYLAHNNRSVNQEGKFILADELGPFGAPITDSKRTGVTPETVNIKLVVFASSSVADEELKENTRLLADRIIGVCGGEKDSEVEIRYYQE